MNSPYTYARISTRAITRNLGLIRKHLSHTGHARTAVMAVVKSDAYGHGMVPVSLALERAGIDALGVAFVHEGALLRDAGVRVPVYVLSGVQRGEERAAMGYGLTPLLYSKEQIEALDRAAKKRGVRPDVHLKIDTGMGRLGFVHNHVEILAGLLGRYGHLHVTGAATHLSDAAGSAYFTGLQIQRFTRARASLESSLSRGVSAHIANTAALFDYPGSHFDMVRPGIGIYGYGRAGLSPAMSIFSRLISVKTLRKGSWVSYGRTCRLKRDTRVGILPVGYADGYSRMLSNKGVVGINGKKVYVIGMVTMNHIMIDINAVDAHVGDEVLIMGEDGGMRIGADEIASLGSTISYEILCGMGSGTRRVYA
ncbi:MAG: alanine racemase [Deltaproteobacteria bacterium]|nr:alanine racemase [Deltaproteobacteria bacterium]